MKPKIAIVRGKFLNKYEMQFFEPLASDFDITAFGSLTSYHDQFQFPVVKLPSPMDLPDVPYKMPILNRLFTDAHLLVGLEEKLRGFDLVHSGETYFRYTQQCLDAKKRGYVKKVIATVLENIPFNNEGIWGRTAYKKRAREELDQIIALTHKTKDALLLEGADPKKIIVISHFVDTKRFAPGSITIKRRMQKDKKEFVILFVGRLETYKGIYDVASAVALLLKDGDPRDIKMRYLFVGDGGQRNQLKKYMAQLGIDRCVSFKQASYGDMPKIYEEADIFVAPSKPTRTYDEQYCTALLEAQAAGLPIVTTKTGGIPENIGDAGLLVTPGKPEELAHAMKRLLLDSSLRQAYMKKAKNRAVTVHDIHIGAEKMGKLYKKVLETRT